MTGGTEGDRIAALEAENARLKTVIATAGLRAENAFDGATPGPDEPRFRTLADTVPHLVWRSADRGQWIWASPNWLAYTGQAAVDARRRGWLEAVHPDDRDTTERAWAMAPSRGRLEVDHRIRCRADGIWHLHHTQATPLRPALPCSQGNGFMEWIGVSASIEELTQLQGGQRNLLLELQHRTRNLLALVRMMAEKSLPQTPERSDFGARLEAMGRVQGFLARSAAWTVALRDLVAAELQAAGRGQPGTTEMTGPEVELPGEVVQPIAMVLHELASNASKHGALAHPAGSLSVTWWLEGASDETRLFLEWRETGVAMPAGSCPPRFGRRIIERTVPYQLRGEAKFALCADGIHCRLALPLGGRRIAVR